MISLRKAVCEVCKAVPISQHVPATHSSGGGISWGLCTFHGVVAACCGFDVWDREGRLLTTENALTARKAMEAKP